MKSYCPSLDFPSDFAMSVASRSCSAFLGDRLGLPVAWTTAKFQVGTDLGLSNQDGEM